MISYLEDHNMRKLRLSICYIKNLISSLAAENPENKVHHKRFMPILQRVIPLQVKGLHIFFDSEENEVPRCMIKMLAECGEIFHLGSGYFTVPPARRVLLPSSNQSIVVSSLEEGHCGMGGLIGHRSDEPIPSLEAADWAYAEDPEIVLQRYESQYEDEPDFKTFRIFQVASKGLSKINKQQVFRAGDEATFLVTTRPFKNNSKEDWYIGRRYASSWRLTRIQDDRKDDIKRLIFALALRNGVNLQFSLTPYNDFYHELVLPQPFSLPKEERNMLSLIGIPEKWNNPSRYLIPHVYLNDVRDVLKRLRMEEVSDSYGNLLYH